MKKRYGDNIRLTIYSKLFIFLEVIIASIVGKICAGKYRKFNVVLDKKTKIEFANCLWYYGTKCFSGEAIQIPAKKDPKLRPGNGLEGAVE